MKLIEADGKELLRRAGLPVPDHARLLGPAESPEPRAAVIKAQVLEGGRGKAGLVRKANGDSVAGAVAEIRGQMMERGNVPLLLLEDQVAFEHEYYLGWRIDDLAQRPVLMFSTQGGMDIEAHAGSLRQHAIDPRLPVLPHALVSFLRESGVSGRALGAVARFAAELYLVFRREDADLLEINPLAVTAQGGVVALDCKMSVDGAALARHSYWKEMASHQLRHAGMTPLEAHAEQVGVTFVELPGNVALLSGGAGLGMAIVDLLAESGFRAANFCDAVGGSGIEAFGHMAELVFQRAESPEVQAIAVYFTLSATSLKPAVMSVIKAIGARTLTKPLVVGFAADGPALREMSIAEATAAFAELGYSCVAELSDLMDCLHAAIDHPAG